MIQLSHLHVTTGKTIALATQTFVDKMVSLFFNMLGITQLPCLQPSRSGELGYNHLGAASTFFVIYLGIDISLGNVPEVESAVNPHPLQHILLPMG